LTVAAPPRPPRKDEPEALFQEARRHRRHRRLRLVAVALLGLAVAGGAYGVHSVSTKQTPTSLVRSAAAGQNTTIVFLVDVSGSMRSTDVKPTRLAATVGAMRTFLDRLPQRIEVGLVAFSTKAEVVQTPTRDRQLVLKGLRSLQPEAGTALGAGLAAAVKLAVTSLEQEGIRREPGHYLPAAIVLESDGAQNRGPVTPARAAQEAKKAGVRVYGVALGTPHGSVKFGFGIYQNSIPVPPDPHTVQSIARVTGGEAFTAANADRLDSIYRDLGSRLAR
jgi:Ca-activated chloride channel family protein